VIFLAVHDDPTFQFEQSLLVLAGKTLDKFTVCHLECHCMASNAWTYIRLIEKIRS
jgi:hypothetical protein